MRQAIAAGLDQFAAGLVAALTGDAHAILRAFAGANAKGQVALADADAVERAAATAHSVGQHLAQILQRAAGHLIVTGAPNFQASLALLDLHRATRHDAPISGSWSGWRRCRKARSPKCRGPERGPFENRTAHC